MYYLYSYLYQDDMRISC